MNTSSLLQLLDGIYRIIGILEINYLKLIPETYDKPKKNDAISLPNEFNASHRAVERGTGLSCSKTHDIDN